MIKLAEILDEYKINQPATFKYDPELFHYYPSMSRSNNIEDFTNRFGYADKEGWLADEMSTETVLDKIEYTIKHFHGKFLANLYDGQDQAGSIGNIDMDIRKYSKLIIKEDDNILLLILY